MAVGLLSANAVAETYWPEALCVLGRAPLCAEAALKAYRKADFARYYRYSEKSCRGGFTTGCSNLGVAYEQGLGVQKDYAQARAYYEAACAKHSAIACRNLGNLHLWGYGVPRDRTAALRYLEQACHEDLGEGCNDLARALPRGNGGEPELEKRRALYERACNLGNQSGCANLASALAHSPKLTPADAARAAELASKGCLNEHPHSCFVFGDLLESGIGTKRDLAAAQARYQLACDHEVAGACVALGLTISVRAGGGRIDLERARQLFERACRLEEPRACTLLVAWVTSDDSLSDSERAQKSAAYAARAEAARQASPYTEN